MSFRVAALILLVFVMTLFAVENSQVVSIRFGPWSTDDISLSLIIIASVTAGALMVGVPSLIQQITLKMRIRQQHAALRRLEDENERLKSMFPSSIDVADIMETKETHEAVRRARWSQERLQVNGEQQKNMDLDKRAETEERSP